MNRFTFAVVAFVVIAPVGLVGCGKTYGGMSVSDIEDTQYVQQCVRSWHETAALGLEIPPDVEAHCSCVFLWDVVDKPTLTANDYLQQNHDFANESCLDGKVPQPDWAGTAEAIRKRNANAENPEANGQQPQAVVPPLPARDDNQALGLQVEAQVLRVQAAQHNAALEAARSVQKASADVGPADALTAEKPLTNPEQERARAEEQRAAEEAAKMRAEAQRVADERWKAEEAQEQAELEKERQQADALKRLQDEREAAIEADDNKGR